MGFTCASRPARARRPARSAACVEGGIQVWEGGFHARQNASESQKASEERSLLLREAYRGAEDQLLS